MIFTLAKIATVIKKINQKAQTANDFFNLCESENIEIVFDNMPILQGFVCKANNQNYIFLDNNLAGPEFLFIAFHELAHYFLHEPTNKVQVKFYSLARPNKDDAEADAIALLCLFPKVGLQDFCFETANAFEINLYKKRLEIYETFGE